MSPGTDRCSCSYGHCGSSHWGNRDHCGLAELDCGVPLAPTRGRVHLLPKTPYVHNMKLTSASLFLSLALTHRCRPKSMKSYAQCWGNNTPNTVIGIGFQSCALSSTKCSGSGRSPRLQCHTRPSEIAGQPCYSDGMSVNSSYLQKEQLSTHWYCSAFLQFDNTVITLHVFSIAGYFIPKNTVIIANLFGAHHDPAVWTDSYSFKPGMTV